MSRRARAAALELERLIDRVQQMAEREPRSAIPLARWAVDRSRDLGDHLRLARSLACLGIAQTAAGELPAGIATLEDLLDLTESLPYDELVLRGHTALGAAYGLTGRLQEQHAAHGIALARARVAGDLVGEARLLGRVAMAGRWSGDPHAAVDLLRVALRRAEELERPALAARARVDLATLLLDRVEAGGGRRGFPVQALEDDDPAAELDEAVALAEDAVAEAGELDHPGIAADAWTCLGRAGALTGEVPRVEDAFEMALRHGARVDSTVTMGTVHRAHGAALLRIGRTAEALVALRQACALLEQAGAVAELVGALRDLATVQEIREQHQQALTSLRRAHYLDQVLADEEAEREAVLQATELAAEDADRELQRQRARADQLESTGRRLAEQALELERLSLMDALTGLGNRRALDHALAAAFERRREEDRPFALLLIDIDEFKLVNDRFSHAVGDVVLATLGAIVRSRHRKGDASFRYGGEELAVLLDDTGAEEAEEVAHALQRETDAHPWEDLAEGLRVTISVGVAGGADCEGPEQLIARADEALYAAKRAGRNAVRRWGALAS